MSTPPDALTCARSDMDNDNPIPEPATAAPIWAGLWESRGAGLHLAALDAAVAQVATEAAMDGGAP